MKILLTLTIILSNLLVQSQNNEMILIGDSQVKAKKIVKEMASQNSNFKFKEYNGWYGGINEYVQQYSIWAPDGLLLKSVFVVKGKVILNVVLSSEPPANTTQSRLDEIKNLLRGKNAPPDIVYLRNDTYKVMIGSKFYCYRKTLILFSYNNADRIQTYIIDAANFDALQRYTMIWINMAKNKMRYRFL